MNEKLQEAVVELITKATTGLETATNFLTAEIPDVIHQLLMWKMVNSILTTMVLLIIPLVFFIWHCKFKNRSKVYDEGNPPLGPGKGDFDFSAGVTLAVSLGFLVLIGLTSRVWLQILIAPKLYLIEYAANLVK